MHRKRAIGSLYAGAIAVAGCSAIASASPTAGYPEAIGKILLDACKPYVIQDVAIAENASAVGLTAVTAELPEGVQSLWNIRLGEGFATVLETTIGTRSCTLYLNGAAAGPVVDFIDQQFVQPSGPFERDASNTDPRSEAYRMEEEGVKVMLIVTPNPDKAPDLRTPTLAATMAISE